MYISNQGRNMGMVRLNKHVIASKHHPNKHTHTHHQNNIFQMHVYMNV